MQQRGAISGSGEGWGEEPRGGASLPPSVLEAVERWGDDILAFCREVIEEEPDAWQAAALLEFQAHPQTAMKACKGPGKTWVESVAVWWFMTTRHDANVIVTSITGPNLRDNLWKELARMHQKADVLQAMFVMNTERVMHKVRPKTWWVSPRTWSQKSEANEQANELAGSHGDHVLIVLDEVGDYPVGVLVAAQGIFTVEGQEAKLLIAGNPTRTDGALYHACEVEGAGAWAIVEITGDPEDPMRSPRLSLKNAQHQIDLWGRDNPWVMCNILGKFPPVAADKLLGPVDVRKAMARDAPKGVWMDQPMIWGLDVARMGLDKSVLRKRQGCMSWKARTWRKLDTTHLADQVALALQEGPEPDFLIIDIGGIGAAILDRLVLLGFGYLCIGVDFGWDALDPKFYDRRTEMWFKCSDWVKTVGCLPNEPELAQDLVAPKFELKEKGKQTKLKLQSKEDMRAEGMRSPDDGDALAITFAVPVSKRQRKDDHLSNLARTDWNPLGEPASA